MSYTLSLLRLVPSRGVSLSSLRAFSTPFSLFSLPGCVLQSCGPAGSFVYCPTVRIPLGSYSWVLESELLFWGLRCGLQAYLAVPWNVSLLCFLSWPLQLLS